MKCICGCENEVKEGNKYILGHHIRINNPNKRKKILYAIPSLCECGCKEVTWNGNKYINGHSNRNKERSEETKNKISKKISILWHDHIYDNIVYLNKYGKNNPMYGKHHTIETKNKISQTKIEKEQSKGNNNPMKRYEVREKVSGVNSYLWRGGISFQPYCFKFNNILKEKIRNRDGRICQKCGKTEIENKQKLTVHHIHYDKPNCNPDLISLCRVCNIKANFNRDYWETFYMNKLKERGY